MSEGFELSIKAEQAADITEIAEVTTALDFELAMMAHQAARVDVKQLRSLENSAEVICVDCGDVVDAKRVKAKPDCVRCLDCQALKELGERKWI